MLKRKIVCAVVMCMCLVMVVGMFGTFPANAYNDSEAEVYGFSVDMDYYKKPFGINR